MAQFTLHDNANPQTRVAYPYLMDVQADLLDSLKTRMVIPVVSYSQLHHQAIANLCPVFELNQDKYLLLTQQMASIPLNQLGSSVADLSYLRNEVVAAIDFLVTGI